MIAVFSPPAFASAATISPYTSSSVTPGARASRAAFMPTSAICAASRSTARSRGDFTQRSSRTTSVPSTIFAPLSAASAWNRADSGPFGRYDQSSRPSVPSSQPSAASSSTTNSAPPRRLVRGK